MELHSDKCHLLLSTKEQTTLKIGNLHIKNCLLKKILGINLDYKLKASTELNGTARLALHRRHQKTYSNECFLQVAIQLLSFNMDALQLLFE